jgi:type VI secretion system secreted protein VgrG
MAIADTKRFSFVSGGLPEDTFSVVTFKGTEGISRLYEFDITLASDDPDIDLKEILQNPATLTIHGSDQAFPIHGILAQFEQLHEVKGNYFYRALLVPRLWQADLYHENQLFLDKSVPDIIAEILRQTGLTTQDYELKLTKKYPRWEYICQFRETDFDFISRWMEREGIYYFFEQGEQNEKLIITDNSTAHKDIADLTTIPYSPPSGLAPEEEAIKAFFCRQKRLPKKVILNDYNYRKPSLELKADTVVDAKGRGNVYFYGEHFKTPEEGHALAKVRAEEIRCRENLFHGEGTQPALCPGFIFEIAGHYRESYNQKYLIAEIEHQGGQASARPERNTTKPRFYGTMNAKVDAAGIGQYAEIDEEGRYKVKLPFDQNGNNGGKASRWVRMVQPYAGADHGMHFPLHKGTEVLLTFVDGDPDRPIIAGAVPNAETKSVVTSLNATRNTIKSASGNVLEMQDLMGMEKVKLSTPYNNSYLHLGAPGSPVHEVELKTDGNMRHFSGKNMDMDIDANKTVNVRNQYQENIGLKEKKQYNYQRTVEKPGNLIETVEGNKTETVKKDYSGTVEGNKAETVKKDYTGTVEGHQAETVNGNKTETIKGNKTVTIDGVQNVTVKGNRSMRFNQPTHDEYGSISSELVYGLKNSVFIGGSNSTDLALARSNFCGAKIDHFLGLKLETLLAAAISIKSGINLEIGQTLDYEMKGVKIEQKGTELKKNLAEISHKLMVVHSGMKIHT